MKSPWRLRFEKFLNHQELTPISPGNDQSVAFQTAKVKTNFHRSIKQAFVCSLASRIE